MLNIYWLNPQLYTRMYYPDIGWMNFNTYMPDYNWIQPIIDWESVTDIDQIIQDILSKDTNVLCISTYEWNYILCHEVAKQIKRNKNQKSLLLKVGHIKDILQNFLINMNT